MTRCCPPPRMRWSGAIGALARGKRVSTGCGRTHRFVRAWRWICGVKATLKAGNTPSPHFIVHGLGKPGGFTSCFTNSGSCFILQVLYLRTLGIFSVVSRGDVFEGKCRKMLCMDLQVIG